MPPLIQQVCRCRDSYSSSAADARWDAATSGFMALCAVALPGLHPPPTSIQIAWPLRGFHQRPVLMEFPTLPNLLHHQRGAVATENEIMTTHSQNIWTQFSPSTGSTGSSTNDNRAQPKTRSVTLQKWPYRTYIFKRIILPQRWEKMYFLWVM